jgi:hypothetical protein
MTDISWHLQKVIVHIIAFLVSVSYVPSIAQFVHKVAQ